MTFEFNIHRANLARFFLQTILVASVFTAGCAQAAPPTTSSSRPATSRPATSRPATRTSATTRSASTQPANTVLKLTDALPLEAFQGSESQVDFVSKFVAPQSGMPLFFGTVSGTEGQSNAFAIIAVKLGDTLRAIKVEDDRLSNASWAYAGAGPALGEIWGILDDSADPPGADLVLVHSLDGGATWQVSSLHKPTEQADFSEFVMDRTGHGRLSVYLSADCVDDTPGPADPRRPNRRRRVRREPVRAGSYHFRTSDGGKTWTLQHEPDAMTPGGNVPETEQPQAKTLVLDRKKTAR